MQSYDDNKPSKLITYLDANNLYGWAMGQYLPHGGFKWVNKKKIIDKFCFNSIGENSPTGYISQVDLQYLDESHELHNDYPSAPEKLEISDNMLSNYCGNIGNEHGIKIGGINKLVSNLGGKCYKILSCTLSLGIKLVKINKIIKFQQSDWLKKYIDFNIDKRKNASNLCRI